MQDIQMDIDEFYLRMLNTNDDLANYIYWMSNPQNSDYIVSAQKDYILLELKLFIEDYNSDKNILLLGVFDKSNNKDVGNIKFNKVDSKNKSAVMGVFIDEKKYCVRGLAKKVIELSIKWLNFNLDIKQIYLGVGGNSTIAINLYIKLGFKTIKMRIPESYSMLLDITGNG
jgi:RimJ/RimL family protein N-acetyltransferase